MIADESANPAFVAADLLSQAEHGPDSQVVLVTTSPLLADAIAGEIKSQLAKLNRRDIAAQALGSSLVILCDDLAEACAISNAYAPEHLIVQTRAPAICWTSLRMPVPSFWEHGPPSRSAITPAAPITPCQLMAMPAPVPALASPIISAATRCRS